MIDERMIVFHSQRKAIEFIDMYDKCQDEEKLAVEQVPGYNKRIQQYEKANKNKRRNNRYTGREETKEKTEEQRSR